MPQIPLPPFIVVPDSNVLFSKTPEHAISKGFRNAWSQIGNQAEIKLTIPGIVRDELLARRIHISKQALENAAKNWKTIESLSGLSSKVTPKPKAIQRAIGQVLDKCLKELKADFEPVPASMPWKTIVRDSIERNPPFTSFKALDDQTETDKGFKDAILLETFSRIALKAPADTIKVLLTKDELVRQAFRLRFGSIATCICHETVEEFGSYLKLRHENRKNEIAQKIQSFAASIFYQANDPTCLYYKFQIADQIRKSYSLSLDSGFDAGHNQPKTPFTSLLGTDKLTPFFQAVSEDKFFIDPPVLSTFNESDGFIWKTRIRVVKLFKRSGSPQRQFWTQDNERIRVTEVDVFWKSTIDNKGEFQAAAVSSHKLVSSELASADFESKMRFGFSLFESKESTST